MGSVHNTENILTRHKSKARKSRLEVVNSLSHVALGRKNERSDPVVRVIYLFSFTYLHQASDDLRIGQAGVAKDGTPRLQGLDDFIRGIARKGKAGGRRVDFHCTAESLLGPGCHAVGFIEDDQFLSAWRESHFLLSEAFYAVTDDIDTFGVAISLSNDF